MKIKRGAGLLLLGLVCWALDLAVLAVANAAGSDPGALYLIAVLVGIAFGFAGVVCLIAGTLLLLWGLLRD